MIQQVSIVSAVRANMKHQDQHKHQKHQEVQKVHRVNHICQVHQVPSRARTVGRWEQIGRRLVIFLSSQRKVDKQTLRTVLLAHLTPEKPGWQFFLKPLCNNPTTNCCLQHVQFDISFALGREHVWRHLYMLDWA